MADEGKNFRPPFLFRYRYSPVIFQLSALLQAGYIKAAYIWRDPQLSTYNGENNHTPCQYRV
jgi:hypothetical protein